MVSDRRLEAGLKVLGAYCLVHGLSAVISVIATILQVSINPPDLLKYPGIVVLSFAGPLIFFAAAYLFLKNTKRVAAFLSGNEVRDESNSA